MAGITSTGFVKKTLAEIKTELEAAYRAAYGNSINVRPPSLMGTQIGIAAEREALVWDLAEECWNSRAPSTAVGVSLDNAGELTANERLEATKSQIPDQLLFGDAGTLVDVTTIFSVDGNPDAKFMPDTPVLLEAGTDAVQHLAFSAVPDAGSWTITIGEQTTASLAFGANAAAVQAAIQALGGELVGVTVAGDYTAGFDLTFAGLAGKQPQALVSTTDSLTASAVAVTITPTSTTTGVPQGVAKMIATEVGPVVAQAGTLTVIDTPVTGLTRTKNLSDADLGRLVESDSDYRIRRDDELQKSGASTVEAIRTRLKTVAGVQEAIVFQNTTLVTDGDGRPPKSIQAFVDGGADQDIGDELWLSVAGGIETYGDIPVNVVDSQGLTQVLNFSRPVEKLVYIELDITKDVDVFPSDGEDVIKAAAVTYGDSLKIGESVLVYPKLLPAIVKGVDGIIDIAIRIGLTASPTLDDNLDFAANERAKFDTSRIVVNFV